MGSWLQRAGISVIPCIRWGKKETYDFAFDGIEPGGTIAVGSLGAMKNKETRKIFADGIPELVKRAQPKTIIVYGSYDPRMYEAVYCENIEIREY